MRLAVLDASAIGGGPVSRALDYAAREASATATVAPTLRLFQLFSSCCSSCTACNASGRCTSRDQRLFDAVGLLGSTDTLLLGVPSRLHARDPRAVALLQRLVSGFAGDGGSRGADGGARYLNRSKRAALISSSPPLLGMLAATGLIPDGASVAWRVLDHACVTVVATASVASRFSGPASWDQTRHRARRVGRVLADTMRPTPAPARRDPVPVPAETLEGEPESIQVLPPTAQTA